jgi:hypothetical protein
MILACVVLAGCSTLDKAAQAGKDWYASLPTVIASNTPAITLPEVVKPATPDAGACKCELTRPLVDDPEAIYNAVNGPLRDKGNSEGCPVAIAGYDIRCRIVGKPRGKTPKIASWCKGQYKPTGGGTVECSCFERTIGGVAYAFHFIGWGTRESTPEHENGPMQYHGTTFGFWEMRAAK